MSKKHDSIKDKRNQNRTHFNYEARIKMVNFKSPDLLDRLAEREFAKGAWFKENQNLIVTAED